MVDYDRGDSGHEPDQSRKDSPRNKQPARETVLTRGPLARRSRDHFICGPLRNELRVSYLALETVRVSVRRNSGDLSEL